MVDEEDLGGKELDKIVEEKVEERLDERVEEEVKKRIRRRVGMQDDRVSESPKENVSRRDFLKTVGTGAAGLGALAMLPGASAFNIRSSNPLQYFGDNQTSPNFEVQTDGSLTASSTSVKSVRTKVVNEVVNGSHSDFSTAQEALDFADANGYAKIVFEKGNYGAIEPYTNQYIQGLGVAKRWGSAVTFDGGTSSHAIDLSVNDGRRCTLENLCARTTQGAGTNYDAIYIDGLKDAVVRSCSVLYSDRYGINVGPNSTTRYISVLNNYFAKTDNGDISLGSNSDRCLVAHNVNADSVSNNGTNNVVNSNTI